MTGRGTARLGPALLCAVLMALAACGDSGKSEGSPKPDTGTGKSSSKPDTGKASGLSIVLDIEGMT